MTSPRTEPSLQPRPIGTDELEACERLKALLFGIPFDARRFAEVSSIREIDRTFACFDGAEVAATLAATSLRLSVPGGELPAAGIAGLAVAPQWAGRGLEGRLFQRQLQDARRRGEPLACLCALTDVPPIYSGYGFAVATRALDWLLGRAQASLPAAFDDVQVVPIEAAELTGTMRTVHDRQLQATPGMVRRPNAWWERQVRNALDVCNVAAVTREGIEGYASYRAEPCSPGEPGRRLAVRELLAVSLRAYGALWRHLFATEWAVEFSARNRSVGEPLQWMLADPRSLRRSVVEGLWIRLVDVAAALRSRSYLASAKLIIEVRDDQLPHNHGRYALDIRPGRAACDRTTDEPDLRLQVADLGAIYLGGVRLTDLAHAGRVVERTPGAVAIGDQAFFWPVHPWALTRF